MKASQFSDAQKAFILKQGADGVLVAEICRRAGISGSARRPIDLFQLEEDQKIYGPPPCLQGHFGCRIREVCINLSGLFGEHLARGHDGIRTSPSQKSYPAC